MGAEYNLDPACQGQFTLSQAQCLAGRMHGHKGTGTGRVNGLGLALHAQHIGDAPGHECLEIAGATVKVDLGRRLKCVSGIVILANTHKDAHLAIFKAARRNGGVFQGFPTHLQSQSLLGINGVCRPGRYPEKSGVELVHLGQEPPVPRGDGSRFFRIRIVKGIHIKAVGRDLGNRISPFFQEVPKGFRIFRAWEAA